MKNRIDYINRFVIIIVRQKRDKTGETKK
jgi:hypothetical protein